MGRCPAPCVRAADPSSREEVVAEYASVVHRARTAMSQDCRELAQALRGRIAALAGSQRYEQAAVVRDRMLAVVRAAARVQRLAGLASCAEVVAARRREGGGWEIVLVRHGRLAGTSVAPRGADPWPYVHALQATAEVVGPPVLPAPAGTAEEAERVLHWLETPGTRLVEVDGTWACPLHGAGGERSRLEPLAASAGSVVPFDEPTPSTRVPSARTGSAWASAD
jgi:DNA polymerase-3 subunit epsilon